MKILKQDGHKSGYEFMSFFHEKYNLLMSSGTIYSRLYSMEREGLIKGAWGRKQRIYEITEKGKKTIDFILKPRHTNLQFMSEIFGLTFSDGLSLRENQSKANLKTERDFKTNTWVLLSKDHHEVLKKIHLLEAALINLLRDVSLDKFGKGKKLHDERLKILEDFLKLYRQGVTHHFKIEEVALFPVLRSVTEHMLTGELIVEQLLSEHKTINSKYFQLENVRKSSKDPTKILSELIDALSAHARKEEELLPPLVRSLSKEQLKNIDKKAASLGYRV